MRTVVLSHEEIGQACAAFGFGRLGGKPSDPQPPFTVEFEDLGRELRATVTLADPEPQAAENVL